MALLSTCVCSGCMQEGSCALDVWGWASLHKGTCALNGGPVVCIGSPNSCRMPVHSQGITVVNDALFVEDCTVKGLTSEV